MGVINSSAWTMSNGQWAMGNGQWAMGNGKSVELNMLRDIMNSLCPLFVQLNRCMFILTVSFLQRVKYLNPLFFIYNKALDNKTVKWVIIYAKYEQVN